MFPKPVAALQPNTADFECIPLVAPTGFREYDARWLYPEDINLLGVQAVGLGLGTYIRRNTPAAPAIVVGHDYRSYSLSIKQALTCGLMAAGCEVHDIGLALSPMAYYAQFALDIPSVAMVTASHNDNGWTGIKMGCARPLTFGPDEMNALKAIVLGGDFDFAGSGSYRFVEGFAARYMASLTQRPRLQRKIRAVVACGNGTAGAFAPHVLRAVGVEVIELDTVLDYTFPKYNPNPEDLAMLDAVRAEVSARGADLGLAFDGDGDRCGVIDERGEAIFADKVGVMLARDLSTQHADARFIVDVKSTGLFMTDPVLLANGAKTEFWKTGHSYIKRRTKETGALAGFEKSGHFFFNPPVGHGYDDGLVAALSVLDMLERNPARTLGDLKDALPKTWQSPTMSPHCADDIKYDVVERVTGHISSLAESGATLAGQAIRDINTVNGIRVTLADGTWGLVRASSNKPELVVVVESPVSDAHMRAIFADLDAHLATYPEIGAYNQKI